MRVRVLSEERWTGVLNMWWCGCGEYGRGQLGHRLEKARHPSPMMRVPVVSPIFLNSILSAPPSCCITLSTTN